MKLGCGLTELPLAISTDVLTFHDLPLPTNPSPSLSIAGTGQENIQWIVHSGAKERRRQEERARCHSIVCQRTTFAGMGCPYVCLFPPLSKTSSYPMAFSEAQGMIANIRRGEGRVPQFQDGVSQHLNVSLVDKLQDKDVHNA